MSERENNPVPVFEVDERATFPRPTIPPIRIERHDAAGVHIAVRVIIGIASTVALAMIIFGLANYELVNTSPGLIIPGYGFALLIFAFSEFHAIKYIAENN